MAKLDLKLYRGYLRKNHLVVFGHAFESWAPDKYKLDRRGVWHAFSIFHMFRIKPLANKEVVLRFKDLELTTKTMEDGMFKFDIPFEQELKSGWHEYEVVCTFEKFGIIAKGEILKPFESKFGIISDIDDTFLISHSNSFLKKLWVMLFRNINKRKVFDDVTEHYHALSTFGQSAEKGFNSFFYVSSSEWNLYDFIIKFTEMKSLPKAVIKLKSIKTGLKDFFATGRGSHEHKFVKISEIISFYPDIEYVLLGDDSQHDVYIYEKLCKIFRLNIKAVYIRQTGKKKNTKVQRTIRNIESLNVAVCYFQESKKAIEHSKKIGII
ncbi:MAG: App1 family protein [Brumimicrobium sp.]|nr:App1 family protein [Brumimicrobium sp.]